MKKVINARISVQSEFVPQFLKLAERMCTESNKESGCITYVLYQEVGKASSFIFYEVYEDQAAIDFHNKSAHFTEFIAEISGYLAATPQIDVHQTASEK
jgi:quinol monooxygenase YgiN